MADFNVRSDSVNVEQIMEQIRARIREKRGVDYTEAQIRELANVKLERFLDPRGVRSDLLEQYRRAQPAYAPPELPNYAFEADTLFESTRGPIRWIRKLLLPVLKLFFNPNPLIQALHIQSRLNASAAEREAKRDAARHAFDQLHYEVMHNLVIEMTRLGIEMKNIKMRVESLASRLDFNERRARALESVVAYRPAVAEGAPVVERGARVEVPPPSPQRPVEEPAVPAEAGASPVSPEGPGQRSRRRRRRRGRRGTGTAATLMGDPQAGAQASAGDSDDEGDQEEGAAEAGSPVSSRDVEDMSDQRTARPEPLEHAFGAESHPAERAAGDPAATHADEPAGAPRHQESTAPDPSRTPEQ